MKIIVFYYMNILRAFDKFLIYLRLHKWRSRKTQEQYAFHIWRFINYICKEINQENSILLISSEDFLPPLWLNKNNWKSPIKNFENLEIPNIEEIKKSDFDEWRLSLSDGWLSIKTTNAHIITMRSWLKFLKKEGVNCLDPTSLDLIKTNDREVTFLTNEEIQKFFDAINLDSIQWKRDFAIAECIYSTGLRISELTALNRDDINLETMEFAVRWKWWKLRVVYLTERAKIAIEKYLEDRQDQFSPLFIRHNFDIKNIKITELTDDKVRLTRFFITNMIKNYWLKAWIFKNLHAHTLRHSFATTLLTNGADIRIIQELLGHSSITTTQVYTHVTNPKLKEAHKKFHK